MPGLEDFSSEHCIVTRRPIFVFISPFNVVANRIQYNIMV